MLTEFASFLCSLLPTVDDRTVFDVLFGIV